MTKELFAKKIISLRKKHHLTQQELADKLNISNKTVSRWETAESYPDIELLEEIAEIFGVSIDYLLTEKKNSHDIGKSEIISYVPHLIGFSSIVLFYVLEGLKVPQIFSFILYFFLTKASYRFYQTYTAKENGQSLLVLNTLVAFFVCQEFVVSLLSGLAVVAVTNMPISSLLVLNIQANFTLDFLEPSFAAKISLAFIASYIISGCFAYYHYQKYKKEI